MNRNEMSENMAWILGICAVVALLIVVSIGDTVESVMAPAPAPVFVCKEGVRYLITQDGAWPQIDDNNRVIHCEEKTQ